MEIFYGKRFRLAFLSLILIEGLSLVGYLAPVTESVFFIMLALAVLLLAVWRFEWAVMLVLLELMIGSKGYLFFLMVGEMRISIRIALWTIVILIWATRALLGLSREKKWNLALGQKLSLKTAWPAFVLGLAVIWGAVNGLFVYRHVTTDVFLDANAWLYFLLLLPLADVFRRKENLDRFLPLALAALVWLTAKTFVLSFIFSHAGIETPAFRIFRWVRVSGAGEITQVKGGFYRIFMQSQLYIMVGYLACLYLLATTAIGKTWRELWQDRAAWQVALGLIIFFAVMLLSMSRSFWLGLAGGALAILAMLVRNHGLGSVAKKIVMLASLWFLGALASTVLVIGIVTFPVPPALGGFDAASLFSSRASDTEDAAAISRWELLPQLIAKIKEAPILGQGFGATVTYQSSDPRQLASPNRGLYTTYAFEWGWLDIWLKLGIIGPVSYLVLLYFLTKSAIIDQANRFLPIFGVGLVAIAITHFFSPYLNHPLGIGYLILVMVMLA